MPPHHCGIYGTDICPHTMVRCPGTLWHTMVRYSGTLWHALRSNCGRATRPPIIGAAHTDHHHFSVMHQFNHNYEHLSKSKQLHITPQMRIQSIPNINLQNWLSLIFASLRREHSSSVISLLSLNCYVSRMMLNWRKTDGDTLHN